MSLHIVIPVFNSWPTTRRCLAALRGSTCKDFEVIVVDHGTDHETEHGMAQEFPDYTRITAEPSLWWAGATNTGVRYALACGAERVMLLNNDAFVEPKTIELLLNCAQEKPHTVVASVQVSDQTGKIMSAGMRHKIWLGFAGLPGFETITEDMKRQGLVPVDLIGGGRGVIIPASVFTRIGLFDEVNLPHYYADHDFYLRCKKSGIGLYLCVTAQVRIDETTTSIAHDYEKLTFREFIASFRNPKSHRNVSYLKALFKKHYPVKQLYLIGYWLSVVRYCVMYVLKRPIARRNKRIQS